MRLLKLFLVVLIVCAVMILPIHAVNIGAVSTFSVYIGTSGSIGFTMQPHEWVTVTVSTGNLNSSIGLMGQTRSEGYFSFTPNETGSFTMGIGNLTAWIDGTHVGSGYVKTMSVGVPTIIRWRPIAFDPFEYYTYPAIGLAGFIFVAISGFYTAHRIRHWEDFDSIMGIAYGIVCLIIGAGLIMVWLWG